MNQKKEPGERKMMEIALTLALAFGYGPLAFLQGVRHRKRYQTTGDRKEKRSMYIHLISGSIMVLGGIGYSLLTFIP